MKREEQMVKLKAKYQMNQGTTTNVGMQGYVPEVKIAKADPNVPSIPRGIKTLSEKEIYEKMWTVKDYRNVSPGEEAANTFLQLAKPAKGDKVIDFGTGTGRGAFALFVLGGMDVTALDFAENCLDEDIKPSVERYSRLNFEVHDLLDVYEGHAEYGYCTDVMEHIQPERVDEVLFNILHASRKVFFRISTKPDVMGPKYLNRPLHLTVEDHQWWKEKFEKHGAVIMHDEDLGGASDFYVTCWHKENPGEITLNVDDDVPAQHIIENAKWPCKTIRPHQLQDTPVILLAGGPSLNDYEDEIIEAHKNGTRIWTVNGAYNSGRRVLIQRLPVLTSSSEASRSATTISSPAFQVSARIRP